MSRNRQLTVRFSSFLNHRTHIFLAVFMGCLLLTSSAPYAAEQAAPPKKKPVPILTEEQAETLEKESTQGEDIPLLDDEAEKKLESLHEKGNELVNTAAEWLDSFFDDPRYLAEENRSRAKLKLKFGYTRFDDFEFEPSLDLRLHLPKLEGRANVFIRANDDSDFDADSAPITNTEGGEKNDGEEFSVGVQYFLGLGEKYNLSTDFGLSIDYAYAGLRYRYLHSFPNETWEGRFTNRLRYYTDDGWENKASYDIEHHFSDRFFFRTTVTGILAERYEGIPFSTVFRLYQVLNIDSAILYDTGFYFDTEPEFETTDVQLRIRYRQRFFRDWLVLEVAPQVTFPSKHDHEYNPGLVVKFEADFGYLRDHQAYDSIFKF